MTKYFTICFCSILFTSTAHATLASDCIKMADESRAEMLRYKDGKSDEATVRLSTKNVTECINHVEDNGKTKFKEEAILAWKAFCKMREEKILPIVVRYNQTAKDNKVNLDETKEALKGLGENPKAIACIQKADEARAALLLYKDGKGDELAVNQLAKDTSACINEIDAKDKEHYKKKAITSWKIFRAIREGKIIPDVKYFMEQSNLNTSNLIKTKNALNALSH